MIFLLLCFFYARETTYLLKYLAPEHIIFAALFDYNQR